SDTQSWPAFHTRIGRQQAPATAPSGEGGGRSRRRRCGAEVSRNSPSDGTHRAIVYFASTPSPTASPAAGQAQADPRKTARWPSTRAQPQQQAYGASMVISVDPAEM